MSGFAPFSAQGVALESIERALLTFVECFAALGEQHREERGAAAGVARKRIGRARARLAEACGDGSGYYAATEAAAQFVDDVERHALGASYDIGGAARLVLDKVRAGLSDAWEADDADAKKLYSSFI